MMASGRTAVFGLCMLSLMLCGVIAYEVSVWRGASSVAADTRRVAANGRQVPEDDADDMPSRYKEWLDQVLGRPLFSPDRRPVEVQVGARGLPRLTGIIVAGTQRVAIFAAASGQHPVIAEAGARVGAYQVQSIADEGVTVLGPEGTTLVRPIFDPSHPAAPAGPVARLPTSRASAR